MSMGIGYMPMPEGFQYAELVKAGRPQHQKFDDFWCRHPKAKLNTFRYMTRSHVPSVFLAPAP